MGHSLKMVNFSFLIFLLSQIAGLNAVNITVSIEKPGVQTSTATFDYCGIELFDALPTGINPEFTSSFGFSDVAGIYHDVTICDRDIYGGAFGIGKYPGAWRTTPYSLRITEQGPLGVNYFGYWLSALDDGNHLEFYSDGNLIFQFTADDVNKLVSSRPDYLGNPTYNPREDDSEPFVFLNFFCNDCTIDEVRFSQLDWSTSGYETDNHTVGHFNASSGEIVTTTTTTTTTSTTIATTTTSTTATTTTATTTTATTTSTTATTTTATTTSTTATTTTTTTTTRTTTTTHAMGTNGLVIGLAIGSGVIVAGVAALGTGYYFFNRTKPVDDLDGIFEDDDWHVSEVEKEMTADVVGFS